MFGRSVFDKFSSDPFYDFGRHSNLGSEFPGNSDFAVEDLQSRAVMPKGDKHNTIARPNDLFNDGFGHGMFDIMQPMKNMDNMFKSMRVNMDRMMQETSQMQSAPNTNGYSYSSSSFYSYDGSGGSEPKVYQAHHAVHSGPGGVKEERKAMRDSTTGEERMHMGQHINDRGRIYEKKRNIRNNTFDEHRDYIGMAQAEEPMFHQEWIDKTRGWTNRPNIGESHFIEDRRDTSLPYSDFPAQNNDRNRHLAIKGGESHKSHSKRRDKEKKKESSKY